MIRTHLAFLAIAYIYLASNSTVKAQTPEFWGTTRNAGSLSQGNIFRVHSGGNDPENILSFDTGVTTNYATGGFCEASNGKLYGLMGVPGSGYQSMIAEYDPATQLVVKKIEFPNIDGREPRGQMVEAPNGKLYGVTSHGGVYNNGVLFEYDFQANIYTKKYDFGIPGVSDQTYCSLTLGSNGKLYGTTRTGGTYNLGGILFEFDPDTGVFTVVHNFDSIIGGIQPYASPVQAPNGKLYGTTRSGGVDDKGTIYEYDPVGTTVTKVYDFPNNYYNPDYLVMASNGKIYGGCWGGISLNNGLIFEFDPDTYNFQIVHEYAGGLDGSGKAGYMMEAADGYIYGFCSSTYYYDFGAIYKFDYNTTSFEILHTLDTVFEGGGGWFEHGFITESSVDGFLYSNTGIGGLYNFGAMLKIDPVSEEVTSVFPLNTIELAGGQNLGELPLGSLIVSTNNKVYGTTSQGGDFGSGVLFEYDPATNIYTKQVDFDGSVLGSQPGTILVEADNGKIYLVTEFGGSSNMGTLVEYNPGTNMAVSLMDFDGTLNGGNPKGGLIQASNGLLYGLTSSGGLNNDGVLFEYNILTGVYTKHHDFSSTVTGSEPFSSLYEASDGMLYGTTNSGGSSGAGVIFEFDPGTNTVSTLVEFDGTTMGANPQGSVIEGDSGKIYGMTRFGGTMNEGVLFEYDFILDNFTNMVNFSGPSNGAEPRGSLMKTNAGEFMGVTSLGGVNNKGIIFSYDFNSQVFLKTFDFDSSATGMNPCGGLVELIVCSPGYTLNDSLTLYPGMDYLFPDGNLVTNITSPMDYQSSLMSVGGCDSIINTHINMGIPLSGDVFTLPVSVVDSCDGLALALISGGVPPYSYDWYTQVNNEDTDILDSICEGIHTLKVTDFIGDELYVDYFVTDSANYYVWYDTSAYVIDTIFIEAVNCLIDYSAPLDSAVITDFYWVAVDTIPPGDLYGIEITYYQAGNVYVHLDTISMDVAGMGIIYFGVYCPSKTLSHIKIGLLPLDVSALLSDGSGLQISKTILAYPNPLHDVVYVRLSDSFFSGTLIILDQSGRIVHNETYQNRTSLELNLSSLSKGVYTLLLENEQDVQSVKLMKN